MKKTLKYNHPINKIKSASEGILNRLNKQRRGKWTIRFLCVLFIVAIMADFIANNKPLYCKIDDKIYFPILQEYISELGLGKQDSLFQNNKWENVSFQQKIMPPIPYSSTSQDKNNQSYASPFAKQNIPSLHYKHWLGTDKVGRDILAGLIHGTRVSLLVGILSMLLASVIGISIGAILGYYGDKNFYISMERIVLNLILISLIVFYTNVLLEQGILNHFWGVFFFLILMISLLLLFNKGIGIIEKRRKYNMGIPFQLDMWIMRIVETLEVIPTVVILLAILAIFPSSIILLIVTIGFLSSTVFLRFARSEALRIKNLRYIEAARSMGFSKMQIIFHHILPNSITPLLILFAFGVSSAIIYEAFLSFLGIGIPDSEITWGKLLNEGRRNISAWWITLSSGFAIFITVFTFNSLGEVYEKS